MTSKNINYTHQLYNTVTSLIMCLIRDIRTNRYYDNIIITLLYNYYNGIGILLKKGLILPILKHHRRKAHTEIVGFSIVATCQMVVFARTTPSFGGRTSGIFYSKTKGETHEVKINAGQILCPNQSMGWLQAKRTAYSTFNYPNSKYRSAW